jgi:thiol-disulfide isomerase/thioredoxin
LWRGVVRTDEKMGNAFSRSNKWMNRDTLFGRPQLLVEELDDGNQQLHSLSGHERNHLFLNTSRAGRASFEDVSGVSGLDHIGDSRAFALFDYDRDGWQDIALVNANAPLLNLYHNEIGRLKQSEGESAAGVVAVRFVGGNSRSQPAARFACRDGYGAIVSIELDGNQLKREFRCGEGFAAQNSDTMIIGIDRHPHARRLAVRWPSGQMQSLGNVAEGTLVTAFEDSAQSPDGSGFSTQPYRTAPPHTTIQRPTRDLMVEFTLATSRSGRDAPPPSQLKMYTTMATWCDACKRELPQLQHMRAMFPAGILAMYGLPIDDEDDSERLAAYMAKYAPPYELLSGIGSTERLEVADILRRQDQSPGLPSTIVTDADGFVLQTYAGVPTVSDLRKLVGE